MSADDCKMSRKRTDRSAAGARLAGECEQSSAPVSPGRKAVGARLAGECDGHWRTRPRGGLLQRFYCDFCRAPLELALLGLAAGVGPVPAAEEPLPEAAFLEYLGSWEGTDEDWLLFEGAVRDPAASTDEEQSDSSEESPESKDEH